MQTDSRTATAIDASPAPVRVLVAEDDSELRGSLSRDLGAAGHVVVAEVGTIGDVVERTRALTPDVVLLDAHLSPTKLIEVAQTLARETPTVAVVLP